MDLKRNLIYIGIKQTFYNLVCKKWRLIIKSTIIIYTSRQTIQNSTVESNSKTD